MVTAKIQKFADSVTAYLKDKPENADTLLHSEKSATSLNKYPSLPNEYSNLPKTLKSSTASIVNQTHLPIDEDFFHTFKVKDVDVPTCLREPYILTGYMLPEKPLRYVIHF